MEKNIKKFEEFTTDYEIEDKLDSQALTDQEMLEMANYWESDTGLNGIILWIGPTTQTNHGPRIKVSNLPNKTDSFKDCFSISVPDLKINGNVNKKHITDKKLNNIFEFIKLNEKSIIKFCNFEISAGDFSKIMIKV